jgi:hypothetical protein
MKKFFVCNKTHYDEAVADALFATSHYQSEDGVTYMVLADFVHSDDESKFRSKSSVKRLIDPSSKKIKKTVFDMIKDKYPDLSDTDDEQTVSDKMSLKSPALKHFFD